MLSNNAQEKYGKRKEKSEIEIISLQKATWNANRNLMPYNKNYGKKISFVVDVK